MEKELRKIIIEELTKSDVNDLIDKDRNSKEFKDKVKDVTSKVIEELYKVLWTRKDFWSSAIRK